MIVNLQRNRGKFTFKDSIALLQIVSGVPYAVYELATFSQERNLEEKVLLLLWGVASVVDVGSGLLHFARKAGIKVKIPKHIQQAEEIITAIG